MSEDGSARGSASFRTSGALVLPQLKRTLGKVALALTRWRSEAQRGKGIKRGRKRERERKKEEERETKEGLMMTLLYRPERIRSPGSIC